MYACKYCGKAFESGLKLGGHVTWCRLNPNVERTRQSHIKASTGKRLTPEHKEKLRRIANEKVANGTWHNSFSHARTHTYNGIKLYGRWELAYAMWLNQHKIAWRRPTESFTYEWNGKLHRYTPDFYLLDEGVYVEVKGYETERDRAKWQQFPLRLRVLNGEKLYEMGLISSYKSLKTQ